MLTAIISILLCLLIIWLFIGQFRSNDEDRQRLFRLIAVGGSALAIGFLGMPAVAMERLMFGLAGAVIVYESFYLLKLQDRFSKLSGLVDLLPVIVPVIFVYPYWYMISYFFGLDKGIFFYAMVVVLAYLAGPKIKSPNGVEVVNVVIALASVILLLWMTLAAFN